MTRPVLLRRPLGAAFLAVSLAGAFSVPASLAQAMAAAAQPLCSTAHVLDGSHFEIDTNANLKVDGSAATCIDWLQGGTNTSLRITPKADKPSGSGDDSFGQGTAENDANPTIVTGSIPPNKSDLLNFGAYTETNTTPKFLELFWQRVQNPSGTTNMDFELNQKFCDTTATPTNCASNGPIETATPIRTPGDKLITYDLSKGGTVPTISIRNWGGSSWGSPTVISGGANPNALGSVNTSTINAADAGGLGKMDPYTFGEAAISFNAIFPPGTSCRTFGSAYVKSRSSDSFTAELKDFIAPERVNITNCTSLTTTATPSVTIGSSISDTAHLAGGDNPTGSITFTAFDNDQCSGTPVFTNTVTGVSGNGDYTSQPFTPTQVGTYYWMASYSGDANNTGSTTPCRAANESSVVAKIRPTIATTLSASQVVIGGQVHDSATLSNHTATAGGTATYTVYSDNACTQDARDAGTVSVTDGVVPDSNSLTFPTIGTFYWQVRYSGDANNESAMSACTSEQLQVVKAASEIHTAPYMYPQDSTTVSATSGGVPTGNVTFQLYAPTDTTCSSDPVFEQTVPLNAAGKASTNNTTFWVDSSKDGPNPYLWKATYSGDDTHNGATTQCGDERATIQVTDS
ncbi:Ig-like domain-containing protein [Streptomyces sp. NPDC004788]